VIQNPKRKSQRKGSNGKKQSLDPGSVEVMRKMNLIIALEEDLEKILMETIIGLTAVILIGQGDVEMLKMMGVVNIVIEDEAMQTLDLDGPIIEVMASKDIGDKDILIDRVEMVETMVDQEEEGGLKDEGLTTNMKTMKHHSMMTRKTKIMKRKLQKENGRNLDGQMRHQKERKRKKAARKVAGENRKTRLLLENKPKP